MIHLTLVIGFGYVPGMRRLVLIAALLGLTGCSNAPLAGFLDAVAPSRPGGGPPPRDRLPPASVPEVPPPAGVIGPPVAAPPG
jgi:hypothetical protein